MKPAERRGRGPSIDSSAWPSHTRDRVVLRSDWPGRPRCPGGGGVAAPPTPTRTGGCWTPGSPEAQGGALAAHAVTFALTLNLSSLPPPGLPGPLVCSNTSCTVHSRPCVGRGPCGSQACGPRHPEVWGLCEVGCSAQARSHPLHLRGTVELTRSVSTVLGAAQSCAAGEGGRELSGRGAGARPPLLLFGCCLAL